MGGSMDVVVVVGVALEVALEVGTESRAKQSLLNMGAAYAAAGQKLSQATIRNQGSARARRAANRLAVSPPRWRGTSVHRNWNVLQGTWNPVG